MKTKLSLTLVVVLMVAAAAHAQFTYTITSGTVTITGYTSTNPVVVIPSTIDGLPVTAIGTSAFYNLHVAGVSIPASVSIPNSVTSIGDDAFSLCNGLTNITIPNSVTSIGAGAFHECWNLTSVNIPNSVTSIEDSAFNNCTSLTNVTIPDSVTSIGDYAFYECYDLTNVTIPDSVTSIGDGAFQFVSLTNVTIPNSVTNIGDGAFAFNNLRAISVQTNNPAYSSVGGVLFDKSQTTLIEYPGGKVGSYSIPNSVTSIGVSAFVSCSLTSITIPNSVTSIGGFYGCGLLNEVVIGTGVTNIGDSAFYNCGDLTSVYFYGNAPNTGSQVFSVRQGQSLDPATAYYLPGTTGWSNTFASDGIPTALWLPQIQTTDTSVTTNNFGFNVSWADGLSVVVEASPSLSNPVWSPVATNALSGGTFYFTDPQWTSYPSRFYRVRTE
jgi:hypothetical protein